MAMTNRQLKAFIRLVLSNLKEVRAQKDEELRNAKLDEIIDTLQKALED